RLVRGFFLAGNQRLSGQVPNDARMLALRLLDLCRSKNDHRSSCSARFDFVDYRELLNSTYNKSLRDEA
ncbi:hypothetical protein, partial [Stutzerimonas stutzeri]|uniref:hypothetical protein n=1 Tax=Stutzerimonas stutzeri TaxID=316 RepID=UPI001EE71990